MSLDEFSDPSWNGFCIQPKKQRKKGLSHMNWLTVGYSLIPALEHCPAI